MKMKGHLDATIFAKLAMNDREYNICRCFQMLDKLSVGFIPCCGAVKVSTRNYI
jgi:hypothetical protein